MQYRRWIYVFFPIIPRERWVFDLAQPAWKTIQNNFIWH